MPRMRPLTASTVCADPVLPWGLVSAATHNSHRAAFPMLVASARRLDREAMRPLESKGPIKAVAKLRSRKESRLLHLRNQKSGQPIYDETVKPFRFGATHV
jgi:hypothetical protein